MKRWGRNDGMKEKHERVLTDNRESCDLEQLICGGWGKDVVSKGWKGECS